MTKVETDAHGVEHAITWWVYAGVERIRHTAQMRGQWGYDATCRCGWDSRTGGGVRGYVQSEVDSHKWDYRHVEQTAAFDAHWASLSPAERLAEMAQMQSENEKMLRDLREQGLL